MVLVKVFMNYNYNQDNTLVQPITFKHRLDQRKFQFFMMCGADEKICPGPIRRPDWTVTLFDVFDLQEVDSKTNAQNRWSLRCFCSQNLQLVQGQRWTQGNQVFVEILHQLRWNHEVGEFDLLTSMKWCSIYCFGMIWSTSKIIFCQFLFWGRPNCILYLILKSFPLIGVK